MPLLLHIHYSLLPCPPQLFSPSLAYYQRRVL
ncbi:hypothetical protein AA0116_g7269 [Alternaria tenuissima]|nr:hypothetical protein AA0116_g7269 [Alternaria tenuissima]